MATNAPIVVRVPTELRTQANAKAARMGIPLSIVMRQALTDFVQKDTLRISDPEVVHIPELQESVDRISEKMRCLVAKK